jgi:hypothetical protein
MWCAGGIFPCRRGPGGAPRLNLGAPPRIPADEPATPSGLGVTAPRLPSRGAAHCSRSGGRRCSWLVVELPLQLTQHDAEQQVPPRRLRQGAAVASQARQVVACRMEAVAQAPERPQAEVLHLRDERGAERSRDAAARKRRSQHAGVHGSEHRPVLHVQHEPRRVPASTARTRQHGPPEQRDVVVVAAQHALVERLLQRPSARSDRARQRASQHPSRFERHGATVTSFGAEGT